MKLYDNDHLIKTINFLKQEDTLSLMEKKFSERILNKFRSTLAACISAIWYVRNQARFENLRILLARGVVFIWCSIREESKL